MARSLKKVENSGMAPFIFFKDRLATFKNYEYDDDQTATCTSKTLARAGFVWTGGISAICPFCLKELEFDPDDDPWEEHKKRGNDCDFVHLEKLEDSKLTLSECIKLSQSGIVMAQFKKQNVIIEQLEQKMAVTNISATVSEVLKGPKKQSTSKPRRSRKKNP
ncbi:hypothetical protein GCK72_019455 [Caenorhabditis remanei]|uniref:Uncharacterized protein n=1 Tax=Caenorhabditis remanei TaxID=31234 RepID=E3LKW6_CAERE|nr:hypothetical protein GCK72_019455 [Caenorhabditis remanei]EFO99784.1 hypothetical protein CRE_18976 [Caenorhabditis remanei]KAF1752900.1 hypothetical protein GCK72_019455 [Caenorhabditis remanei]